MKIKAALYVRVSTEEQAEKGASIEAQEEFLREWAAKEGFEVYRVYRDEGISGATLERPALQTLIRDAKQRKFQVVLCYHNDRLSRDTKDALTVVQDLLRYGVRVRFSNMDVDITTPEGEMMFTLQAAFATYFRKDLSRKTKFGMQKLKKQGYWVGRIPELFEKIEENGHVRLKPSKELLRARELRDLGYSYREIAEELGIPRTKFSKVYRALKLLEKMGGGKRDGRIDKRIKKTSGK